jgi:hypothetical protein
MADLVRVILAISILWQSVIGLTSGTCAAKPAAYGCAVATAMCECCQDGEGIRIPCPMAANPSIGCNCSATHNQDPVPPPTDTTTKQLPRLVALPIAFSITAPVAPATCGSWRDRAGTAIGRPGHSIQSILCVWLT